MSHKKLRVQRTQVDNLVANLRGELGELITSWLLWRDIRIQANVRSSGDVKQELNDQGLIMLRVLEARLRDDMVARLAELAEPKIGRLNFFFAAVKLDTFKSEAAVFTRFIELHRFKEKRNYDISHKELPETWSEHKHIHIEYCHIIRAMGMAMRLMKQIDRLMLGPASRYLWREMRQRRYKLLHPASAAYMMLPNFRLTKTNRERIIQEEEQAGTEVWTEMTTLVNDRPATVRVAKKWGVIDLSSIKFEDESSDA